MKNEDKLFAAGLALLVLILSMGVSSMINANNIRLHLDTFDWTYNKTSLSPEIQQKFKEKEKEIINELMFATAYLGGGSVILLFMIFKYSKKEK